MLKSEAVRHYGSQAEIGRVLGIGKAAVGKWGELVPRGWAAELHIITNAELTFEQSLYRKPDRQVA